MLHTNRDETPVQSAQTDPTRASISGDAAKVRDMFKDTALVKRYQQLHWKGTWDEYLAIVKKNPVVTSSAYQRIHRMILAEGVQPYKKGGQEFIHYKFFDDPHGGGKDAIFGLDENLMKLVLLFESAARQFGTERRLLLLKGPVGSSKSSIARLLKSGLERYTLCDEGAVYTFGFTQDALKGSLESINKEENPITWAPMHEDPLCLIPKELRGPVLAELNAGRSSSSPKVEIHGGLSPATRYLLNELLARYKGDFNQVLDHVVVKRYCFSEEDRVGIATFQPKDTKNQDSTELTGDINYRALAQYGKDSDPRAFSFDGELCVANRGLFELIEVLKLDVEFLYELLGATQERMIKPKKFPQTQIDEVLLGHTNEPEYRKLQNNEYMEALRDRTIACDIPYVLALEAEKRIYEKSFTSQITGLHIAPHTVEIAAMFAVLSRLEQPKNSGLSLVQKMRLYNGEHVAGFTEHSVKELREAGGNEGHKGVSPRFIQNTFSGCLVSVDAARKGINPFMLIKAFEDRIKDKNSQIATTEEEKKRLLEVLSYVKEEYKEIVLKEVQLAIAGDKRAVQNMFSKYIENVDAYKQKSKIRNPHTNDFEEPDERFMRSVEEKIDIPESRKDDFRTEILSSLGSKAFGGRAPSVEDHPRLRKALEAKLFEDKKDQLNLKEYVSTVIDDETKEKIDAIKQRLIKEFGYNEMSADDLLKYVASIYARGETKR